MNSVTCGGILLYFLDFHPGGGGPWKLLSIELCHEFSLMWRNFPFLFRFPRGDGGPWKPLPSRTGSYCGNEVCGWRQASVRVFAFKLKKNIYQYLNFLFLFVLFFRTESVRWEFNGRFIDTNFRHVIPQVTNHSLNKNLADIFLFIFSKQNSIPWFARSQLDFLFRYYNKRSSLRMLRTFPDEKWPQKRFYLKNIYGFFYNDFRNF